MYYSYILRRFTLAKQIVHVPESPLMARIRTWLSPVAIETVSIVSGIWPDVVGVVQEQSKGIGEWSKSLKLVKLTGLTKTVFLSSPKHPMYP